MKTAGLIGGMSWESTALYYKLLNQGIRERLGGFHSARILLASVDFHEIEAMQQQGQWKEAGILLAGLGLGLEQAGADFVLLCTNTMHKVAPQIEGALSVPFLHLADATARIVKGQGYQRVGLLGTSFTMEEEFYRGRLASQGLDVLIPVKKHRDEVNRVIFDELCCGKVLEESENTYIEVIDEFAAQGAQAVILGCTEIGMLVKTESSSLPLVDTTHVHVEVAIESMLSP
jgi:amino-acid racemase